MKWVLIIGAVVLLPILVMAIGGMMLPVGHVASRKATFKAPRAAIFAVLVNYADYPSWQKSVSKVELQPPEGGRERFTQTWDGRPMPIEVLEKTPPEKLVTRIASKELPFGGTWTYALADAPGGGSALTITEAGEVYNPLFRFMSKYVFGHTATADQYLRALGEKLGEKVEPGPA